MLSAFLLAGVLAIILAGGYAFARGFLSEREALPVAAITVVGGVAIFLIFSNALAYLTGVHLAWTLTLFAMAVSAAWYVVRARSSAFVLLSMPPRWFRWSMGLLILVIGVMNARFAGSDPLAWGNLPLSATIMEGNFPVKEIVNPETLFGYHYAPNWIMAALSSLSGVSLGVSTAFEPLFGAAGVLLVAGALAAVFVKRWKAVFVCAVLALFAMGLGWVHVTALLHDLFTHYVLGHHLPVPFKELTPIFASSYYTSSILNFLGHRPSATGYPFLFAFLFSLQRSFSATERKSIVRWSVAAILFASALALAIETGLVALLASLSAYAVLVLVLSFFDLRRIDKPARNVALITATILPVILLIVTHQGGILSLLQGDVAPSAFTFGFDGHLYYHPDGRSVSIFSVELYREFGLPFLLLPLSILLALRYRRTQPFLLFLCIVAAVHFAIPFFAHFPDRPHDTNRLIFTGLSVGGFLAGIWLSETLLFDALRWKRLFGWAAIVAMVISSSVYLVFRLTFPTFRFESAPLFAPLPQGSPEQIKMYEWVREHTTLSDYFYMGVNTAEFHPPLSLNPPDEQKDRILFMLHTGRFTIGPLKWLLSFDRTKLSIMESIENTCDLKDFAAFNIRFIAIDTPERAAWFDTRCNADDWTTVYSTEEAQVYRSSVL